MTLLPKIGAALVVGSAGAAFAQFAGGMLPAPALDRWMYPFNSSPGTEASATVFAALNQPGFDDRDAQFLVGFNTSTVVPVGVGELRYRPYQARLRLVVSNDQRFEYDPTADAVASSYLTTDPAYVADSDIGKPVELFPVGFRNGLTAATFGEHTAFSTQPTIPPQEGIRSAFAAMVDEDGVAVDVSRNVRQRFEAWPMAIGRNDTLTPGQLVPQGTELVFEIDLSNDSVRRYLSRGLNEGRVLLMVSSLHPASGGPGGGTGVVYPAFYTKENAIAPILGYTASLEIAVEYYPHADFNLDGDTGTDADIEAFFRALAGDGGNSDFNMDGDYGTDADIESFFCALAGREC